MLTPRSTAQQLSKQFSDTFGSRLQSVVLFGSVARGEAIPGVSDVNILVLLDKVTNRDLGSAAPFMHEWVRAGNTPPHLFSAEEWSGMGDTFAIELSDMQDAREVLHGADPVHALTPNASDLRLHAEHEIRETMRHIRLHLLLAANDARELGHLLISGMPSFAAYMRAALRLSDQEAPLETPSVIERTATLIDANPSPMIQCYRARSDDALSIPISDPLVEEYSEFVRSLTSFIDGISP